MQQMVVQQQKQVCVCKAATALLEAGDPTMI